MFHREELLVVHLQKHRANITRDLCQAGILRGSTDERVQQSACSPEGLPDGLTYRSDQPMELE